MGILQQGAWPPVRKNEIFLQPRPLGYIVCSQAFTVPPSFLYQHVLIDKSATINPPSPSEGAG